MWIEKLIPFNVFSRPGTKLKGVRKIVNHFTANPGASAYNHVTYFGKTLIEQNLKLPKEKRRYASAHIMVDKLEAYLIIPLNEVAYHANDIQQRNLNGTAWRGIPEIAPNANLYSIGVELCIEKDGTFHPETLRRASEINAELCKRFKLDPKKDIVRHYDVTHKNCPARWVEHPNEFAEFKNMVAHVMKQFKEKGVLSVQIKKGDKGEMVKLIHFFLASLGYTQVKHAEIDTYQDFTVDAVKRFQKDQVLTKPTPGEVDFETFSAFAKVLHVYYKDRIQK